MSSPRLPTPNPVKQHEIGEVARHLDNAEFHTKQAEEWARHIRDPQLHRLTKEAREAVKKVADHLGGRREVKS